MERSSTSTGLKDCSSLRAHPGMSRCVAIGGSGWMRFRLAMAVACPHISKPKFVENSIGSNCCSSRSRLWRPSGMRCSTQNKPKRRPRRRCCWVSMALGRSSLRSSGLRGLSRHFDNRRHVAAYAALPRRLGKRVGQSRAGHLAIGQPATTDNHNSARLALATPSAALGTHPLVRTNGT